MRRPVSGWIGASCCALLLIITSCASPAIPPPALAVDPPASWTAADPDGPTFEPDSIWWSEFGDPRLEIAIEQVLAANHELAAATARLDAAVAQARIAGAELLPTAALATEGSRSRRNFIGLPIPGSSGGVLSSTSTSLGANLNVSWEVDLWGRLRAGRAGARAGVAAAENDLAGARLSLSGQAAKAWLAVQETGAQVELAERTLELRALSREWIERRYLRGTRGALDLRLAIANQEQARASLEARRRQLDAAGRQLALLASAYPAPAEAVPATRDLPEPPTGLPPLLPAELISRRPDLRALERRMAAAGFDVQGARAALYPRLSLTGSTGRLSSEVEDLLDSDFSVWSLAANLLQPLFQGGRLRAGVDLAEARHRELAETYAQALLRAFAEVELSLVAERSLRLQQEALATAVEQSTGARDLAQRRYEAGLGGYLEVLEAQSQEAQSQIALLTVKRQRLDARVDLHLSLGGGASSAAAPTEPATPTGPPTTDVGVVDRLRLGENTDE